MAFTLEVRVIAVSDSANRAENTIRTSTAPSKAPSVPEKRVVASIALIGPGGAVLAGLPFGWARPGAGRRTRSARRRPGRTVERYAGFPPAWSGPARPRSAEAP